MAEDEEPNNGERDPAHKQIQGITDNRIEVSLGGNLVSVSIDAFILYLYTCLYCTSREILHLRIYRMISKSTFLGKSTVRKCIHVFYTLLYNTW